MKMSGKVIGGIVGFIFFLVLLSFLSWPTFVLAAIALWYYTKKEPNANFQKIALVALVFSFFGIAMGFTDGSAENEPEEPKTEEVAATSESVVKEKSETQLKAEAAAKKKAQDKALEEAKAKQAEEEAILAAEAEAEATAKAETEAAAAAEAEKEVAINIVSPEMALSLIQDSFAGVANVRYDSSNKMYIFTVTDSGVESAILATANGSYPRSNWDSLVQSFVDVGVTTQETLGSGYSIVMENPSNPDNYLFLILDGVLLYNFADEL